MDIILSNDGRWVVARDLFGHARTRTGQGKCPGRSG
jgi:hypothetical protein